MPVISWMDDPIRDRKKARKRFRDSQILAGLRFGLFWTLISPLALIGVLIALVILTVRRFQPELDNFYGKRIR